MPWWIVRRAGNSRVDGGISTKSQATWMGLRLHGEKTVELGALLAVGEYTGPGPVDSLNDG